VPLIKALFSWKHKSSVGITTWLGTSYNNAKTNISESQLYLAAILADVTRTSNAGMAPIHFLPHSCLLPIPQGLCAHTHAIPLLDDHTLTLFFLAIFSLIAFLSICTIFACWTPSSPPLCPLHLTSTHPIISWTPYLTIGPWCCHPLPLLHPWSVTHSPLP
jgi:hypothetical protein